MGEPIDRTELLRQLASGAPATAYVGTLVLLAEDDVTRLNPGAANVLRFRRRALFERMQMLVRTVGDLAPVDDCTLALLIVLFRDGALVVQDVWQAIFTIHGSDYLTPFNTAVGKIIETRCVEVRTPTP